MTAYLKTNSTFSAHGKNLSAQNKKEYNWKICDNTKGQIFAFLTKEYQSIKDLENLKSAKHTLCKRGNNRAVPLVFERTTAELDRQKGGTLPGITDRGNPQGRVTVKSGVPDI